MVAQILTCVLSYHSKPDQFISLTLKMTFRNCSRQNIFFAPKQIKQRLDISCEQLTIFRHHKIFMGCSSHPMLLIAQKLPQIWTQSPKLYGAIARFMTQSPQLFMVPQIYDTATTTLYGATDLRHSHHKSLWCHRFMTQPPQLFIVPQIYDTATTTLYSATDL